MRRTKTLLTDDLQGAGSFVTLRTMSRGERRHLGAFADQVAALGDDDSPAAQQLNQAALAAGDETICACLVAWNWTDAAGEPVPCPPTPADLDRLSDEERQFLFGALYEVSFPTEEEKNA